METIVLRVEGMSCAHCERAVKTAVGALEGVANVAVDLEGKRVTVEFDAAKAGLEGIRAAIEEEGYDVV
jgi:copper chaperone